MTHSLTSRSTMTNTPREPYSTDHIAIVVLCDNADEFTFRTVQECTLHFATVHVIGYGSQDVPQEMKEMMVRLDMQMDYETNVNFSFFPTPDKLRALYEGCLQMPPKQYTHVMLIDAQVGARKALLQDGLSRKTSIPICAYYYTTAATSTPNGGSIEAFSQPRPRARGKASSASSSRRRRRGRLSIPPTFADECDENKPNHFLDLWERDALLELLNQHCVVSSLTGTPSSSSKEYLTALPLADDLQSTFSSLRRAVIHSSSRAKTFRRNTPTAAAADSSSVSITTLYPSSIQTVGPALKVPSPCK